MNWGVSPDTLLGWNLSVEPESQVNGDRGSENAPFLEAGKRFCGGFVFPAFLGG